MLCNIFMRIRIPILRHMLSTIEATMFLNLQFAYASQNFIINHQTHRHKRTFLSLYKPVRLVI